MPTPPFPNDIQIVDNALSPLYGELLESLKEILLGFNELEKKWSYDFR